MPAAFLAVAFFLGAFITNFFKEKKINALEHELSELQSKFYNQQTTSKKQLGEQEVIIKQLKKKNLKNITNLPIADKSPSDQSKDLKTLKDKNSVLEQELKGIKAKYRELKVEKAVKMVEKKYPMQLYGMDGDRSIDLITKSKEKETEKPQRLKARKAKSKTALTMETSTKADKQSEKPSIKEAKPKPKSKKSKKKYKSKKGKSKKVLALFVSGKKGKKKKKSSKSKKKKSKSK